VARPWRDKFDEAFRGIKVGVRGQSSFFAHFFFAALATATAAVLRCEPIEWCLVVGCVGFVFTTELLNTSIETLFKGLPAEERGRFYVCLDMAAGAVLIAGMTSAVIGAIVFGRRMLMCLSVIAE